MQRPEPTRAATRVDLDAANYGKISDSGNSVTFEAQRGSHHQRCASGCSVEVGEIPSEGPTWPDLADSLAGPTVGES
jgi:hypothetical protein